MMMMMMMMVMMMNDDDDKATTLESQQKTGPAGIPARLNAHTHSFGKFVGSKTCQVNTPGRLTAGTFHQWRWFGSDHFPFQMGDL